MPRSRITLRNPDDVDARGSTQETTPESSPEGNATIHWEIPSTIAPISIHDVMGDNSAVLEAVYTGIPEAVERALNKLNDANAIRALKSAAHLGRTPIMHAASRGNLDVFNVVLKEMVLRLDEEELKKALTTTIWYREETLLNAAADGGSKEVFDLVVKLLDGAILEVTARQFKRGKSVVKRAAQSGSLETFKSVVRILKTELDNDQARSIASMDGPIERSMLTIATMGDDGYIVGAWAIVLSRTLLRNEMVQACNDSFKHCIRSQDGCLRGLAVLIACPDDDVFNCPYDLESNGAKASYKDLIHFAKTFTLDDMKNCFIDALAWVDNPFIPGMTISVALDDAAPKGPEREGRALLELMDTVDDILLEVLERLPQRLREFEGGFDGCTAVLEPETVGLCPRTFAGPLRLALDERQFTETFCMAPLVFEYLSRQFVAGLPSMMDTEEVLRSPNGQKHMYGDGLVAHFRLGKLLQGIGLAASEEVEHSSRHQEWDRILGGTVLPGAQFVGVGMLTRPETYYKVPAMRLALDFVVHLVMLSLFSYVTINVTSGPLTFAEKVLIFHVTAAIAGEITEMFLGIQEYFQDKWNVLDMFSLILLSAGLYIRWWGGSDSQTSTAKVFFALSAPLVFSRFLFFAQILRRQGLVIEMITIMLGEIGHFGVVMGVIMIGFAVSFIALIEDNETTFISVLVSVFNAMLGEVSVFEEENFVNDFWATLLIILYLIIMSIMMLNLLIAVLSTEHSKVDERSDREFGISKVRMIKLYRRVVDKDILPPPFNLVQLAILFPFFIADSIFHVRTRLVVRRAVGVTIFWAVTGPIVVILGSLLWVISIPHAVAIAWEGTYFGGNSLFFRVLLCYFIIPFYSSGVYGVLVVLWLQSAAIGICYVLRIPLPVSWRSDMAHITDSTCPGSEPSHRKVEISVPEMLSKAPERLGVREIWEYLKDPNTPANPAMRREEQCRPATVEHIRQVKNNLDALKEIFSKLQSRLDEGMNRQVDKNQMEDLVKQVVERTVEQLVADGFRSGTADDD